MDHDITDIGKSRDESYVENWWKLHWIRIRVISFINLVLNRLFKYTTTYS